VDRSWSVKKAAMNTGLIAAAVFAVGALPIAAADDFSGPRAMTHVTALAGTIGPRKTGTPGELAGREYIAARMREIGLTVRRLPVARLGQAIIGSENIVGILKGRIADTILIGSHHDSRSTTVPGADDDASGVAVMLETARVLAASPPAHTMMFAAFCAEEEGLLGARHFAQTQDLSSLRLVINLDPVGQREIFVSPFPSAPPLWASRALAAAASPGVTFDPLYLLVTRTLRIPFGADHEAFLEKSVPAFSLSDRFRIWTYHTSEDRPEWVETGTLATAGAAVLSVVRRFDENPSAASVKSADRTYVILPLPGRPVFVVTGAIYALAAVVALLATLWWRAVWWKRARRGAALTRADVSQALVRAALPLAGAILGALLSETLSQILTGYRFSWTSRQGMHLLQAACFAMAGFTAGCLRAARRRAPEEQEAPMMLSVALSGVLGFAPLAALRPDLGFYYLLPAAATLAASLLRPAAAGLGTLAGSLPLLALVTPSNYADAVAFLGLSPPPWIAGPAMMLAMLPLALGLSRSMPPRMGERAGRLAAAAFLMAGAAFASVNAFSPSYDAAHRRLVRVVETLDLSAGTDVRATVRFSSAESLRRIRTDAAGLERLDTRATERSVGVDPPSSLKDLPPPEVSVTNPESSDDSDVRDLRVSATMPAGVDRARITMRSTEPLKLLDDGVWVTRNEFTRRHVSAGAAPSDLFRISGRTGQSVEVEMRIEIAADILGVHPAAEDTVFQCVTLLTWRGSVML